MLSSLPFFRNELFIGRTDELRSLEQYLLIPNTHRRRTVYGLGGCGKSALAIEFAHRALATHARLVFWVPAISQESFELAYREIGARLHIPGIADKNADVKKLVRETLSSECADDWLMVVDNADDYEVLLSKTNSDSKPTQLSDYLPRSDRGAILFTTRSRKVAAALTPSSVLRLDDMSQAEARQLLTQQTSEQTLCSNKTAIDELLETLAYLPLAIVQAAAFMSTNDVSVSDYLVLLRDTDARGELFNEKFTDHSRYMELDSTIAKTWHISFDQIRKQDPLAAEYLSFMACIDRINIPQSLLPPGASMVQQMKALGTLTGYAFITERSQTAQASGRIRFFDMHRLVHMASAFWLDAYGERAVWVDAAVARLEELVPYGGYEFKHVWTTYLPHATHVVGKHNIVDEIAGARLLDRVGRCQRDLGRYSTAEITHRQALSIRARTLGLEHPDTLMSMESLAVTLSDQGKYAEAEKTHRETLRLHREVLGETHPVTLGSMNNLALTLAYQGEYAEAKKIHQKTLRLCVEVLGETDPDTLKSMNNLAYALSEQGEYADAERMHQETFRLRREVLGETHLETITSMYNLAHVIGKQARYDESGKLYEQACAAFDTVLGKNHPETRACHGNYRHMLTLQEEASNPFHSEKSESSGDVRTTERPRLA